MTTTESKFIYLDNAASTKIDEAVRVGMLPYFSSEYGNPSSSHSFGQQARTVIENARRTLAKELGCEPEEIIFTSGGTEANNLALVGIAYAQQNKGKHIITTQIEHPSIIEAAKYLERTGFSVTYLPVDNDGLVSLAMLSASLRHDTILVSIMHANNEIGTIQPIDELAAITKNRGVIFHTDAVQSFKKTPFLLERIDACSLSAHKIHGPKGVGALFVQKKTHIQPLLLGGEQEHAYRAGTENGAAIVGFGLAAQQPIDIVTMEKQRDVLINSLLNIPGTKLNGHPKKRLPNSCNISFKGIEAETLLEHLSDHGIMASIGSACKAHELVPSYVLKAIGLSDEQALGTIRLSLSKYTTDAEIEYTAKTITTIVASLRALTR